jgi:serine/threonine protein kinase
MQTVDKIVQPPDDVKFDFPVQQPEILCPDAYIFVSTAGTAKHGDVIFRILKDALSYNSPDVVEASALSAIKNKAVAVKTLRKQHAEEIEVI